MNKEYWETFYAQNSEPFKPSSFANFCLKYMPDEATILDVACGNGRDSIFFAEIRSSANHAFLLGFIKGFGGLITNSNSCEGQKINQIRWATVLFSTNENSTVAQCIWSDFSSLGATLC